MASTRTYGDSCGIARALDVVGERWALLVVREKRFTDLRDGLPHVGPDILSQRLRQLEQAGVLGRRKLAPPAGAQVYELTDRGRELEPIVLGLGRWGSRVPMPPGDPELGTHGWRTAGSASTAATPIGPTRRSSPTRTRWPRCSGRDAGSPRRCDQAMSRSRATVPR